jgi:predicted phosphodiesterase
MDKKTKQIVASLLKQGLGRRQIAKRFGVTEWAARKMIDKVVKSVPELIREDTSVSKPKSAKVSSNIVSKSSGRAKTRTNISIRSADDLEPRRHKKIHRDIALRVAVLSDIHYPYEDDKACEVADMFLEEWKPDILVYNGDVADCYAVSAYDKSIDKKMNIQEELDYTHDKLLERKNRLTSVQTTYMLVGNHETRLNRLINKNAQALMALRGLTIDECLKLRELDIEFIPHSQELEIGKLMFTHGHLIRKHAGNSARGHYEQYGCSVLVGHCHRLSQGWKRNKFGNHAFIENGTLCDFDVEYARYPDWQHGFTTLEFDGDDFSATVRPIVNYKLIADRKVYAI